jgi:hypothetical protein
MDRSKFNSMGEHYERYGKPNYAGYNNQQYGDNKYDEAYNEKFNQALSLQREPTITYTPTNYYISFSSKDRDITAYPNPNHYVTHLPQELRNIVSIELIQAIIPNASNINKEPYLLLKIDELEDTMMSNDRHMSDAFAMLQIADPVGDFIQIDKRIHENTVKEFRTPKANLSRLTVTITDHSGTPYDFGGSGSTDKEFQNTFVFKVVCLEKGRDALQNRSVF